MYTIGTKRQTADQLKPTATTGKPVFLTSQLRGFRTFGEGELLSSPATPSPPNFITTRIYGSRPGDLQIREVCKHCFSKNFIDPIS